ncbi:hypothetical protein [Leclercia adecarboxylata]|uniref:hypothetical protein n=1 Tax=Leclercia adecarboxylata TaxID=83655 RepID=UPI0013FD8B2E|nr:hypothetical protein [Leclercia adecarboxylata]QIM43072.1 hypothetical protein G7098_10040 [Leclercia adecarboxylata]
MNRFSLILSLFLALCCIKAKAVNATTDVSPSGNTLVWEGYFISKPIIPGEESVSENSIDDFFKGKKIVIDDKKVTIGNTCIYEYSKETMTPLEYWHSKKTVNFYKKFLSFYKVKLGGKLNLITPTIPPVECGYPFTDFIELDGSLLFIFNNRAVIYDNNNNNNNRNNFDASGVICLHKGQSAEQIFENGDIEECFYKGENIFDSYQKYRGVLTDDGKKYLQESIVLNKDSSMKCYDGCIAVIYKWDGPDRLTITQQFEGGETEISFTKETQGCRVVTKSFPD